MRLRKLAIGPVLTGCALIAVTSCSTDEKQTESGLGPSPISPAITATSAYDIVKVGNTAINVDGNLGDWATISGISMSDDPANGRGALNNSATVKLAWNDTYLYAAYNVSDTELLAAQTVRDHPDLYKDDAIELYIDPQGDGSTATSMTATDYQLLANVREALGDNRGTGTGSKDETFNAASFLAKAVVSGTLNTTGGDNGYTIEVRIAWTDLGVTPTAGNFMRLDLAVDDDDTANTTTEEFDWAGLSTSYNNPSGWHDVQLVNPPPPVSAYNLVKVPGMTVDGDLSDWTGIAAIPMADSSGRTGGKDNTAKVKLAWDNTYLYAAYDVTDTELLAAQTLRDHADIYKDDAIELYIDPEGDGANSTIMSPTEYQFLANARNALGDKKGNGAGGKDAGFNAGSFLSRAGTRGTLNAAGTDTSYAIEFRIAWADLGVTPGAGNFMRVDLAVDDNDTGNLETQEFDWANPGWSNPSLWRWVGLVADNTAPVSPTNSSVTTVSSSQIDVAWTASTSTDVAKYNIYRAISGTPTLYQTVAGSPYHDTGLTPGTTYTYQISAVDAAGNESPKTSAKSVATSGGAGGPGLPVGLANTTSNIGEGPGGDTGNPTYGAVMGIVTPSNVDSRIAQADAEDVTLVLNLADSRNHWTDPGQNANGSACNQYNAAEYEAQVRRFQGNATLADAISRHRVIIYVVDEPAHPTFCTDVPKLDPAAVNQMGLLVKSIWPGAITTVRASARNMATQGWDGSGPLGPGFWTGIDYGWAQYEGTLHVPSGGETPAQFFSREKSQLASVNLGMVPGHNILNGGVANCWDYQNTGSSSGRIHGEGSVSGAPGRFDTCSTPVGSETRWASSPADLRAIADAVYNDPDAPFLVFWTHIYSTFPDQVPWAALENRSDYVAALDYVITKAGSRTSWNGWRTAK